MTEDYPMPSSYYRSRMVARLLKLTFAGERDRMDDKKWRSNKKGDHFPIVNGRISSTWLNKRDYARFCTTLAMNIRNRNYQMIGKYVATPLHDMYKSDVPKLVLSTKSMYNPVIKYVIEFNSSDDMYDYLEEYGNGSNR